MIKTLKPWAFWATMIVVFSIALDLLEDRKGFHAIHNEDRLIGHILLFDVIGIAIWAVRRSFLRRPQR